MTDVFISYSRKDSEFVRTLQAALAAEGRDAWVDWEDIPLTADWRAEIQAAIEGAESFVFVLSPDSLASRVCADELGHAVANNKRLLPVIRREVDAAEVPEALARLNWLFFREEDDFPAALRGLTAALDTDLAWVKAHTRLQVRALEWERQAGNASYLLRGQDLSAAEDLIAGASESKQPLPTPLQRRFILESRRASTRGQRLRLTAVTAALVATVVLAALAWGQRTVAVAQEQEAERQRALAVARQLAAQAELLTTQQPPLTDRALLLAIEALRAAPSPEAYAALSHALQFLPRPTGTASHDGRINALAYEPVFKEPAQYIATASEDGTASVWDAASLREVSRFNHDGPVVAVALKGYVFGQAGQSFDLAATASRDGTAALWNPHSGALRHRLRHDGPVTALALSATGRLVATGSEDGTARVWDVTTGAELLRVRHDSPVTAVAVVARQRPDRFFDDFLVSGGRDGTARLWAVADGRELARLQHDGPVVGLAVRRELQGVGASAVERLLVATASADGSARLWEAEDQRERARLLHNGPVNAVTFSPTAQLLLTASDDNTARLWDISTGAEMAQMLHDDAVTAAVFGGRRSILGSQIEASELVATASRDGTARIWERRGAELLRLVHQAPASAVTLVFTDLGQKGAAAVSGDTAGTLRRWEVTGGEERLLMTGEDAQTAVAFSPDGTAIATGGSLGRSRQRFVLVWSTSTGDLTDAAADYYDLAGTPGALAGFSPDGKVLAVLRRDSVQVSVRGTSSEWYLRRRGTTALTAVWSADKEHIFVGTADGRVTLWPWTGGIEQQERFVLGGPATAVALSPDGATIAAAGADSGGVVLWDERAGREIARLTQRPPVVAIAFSPDGRLLATAGGDGAAAVWESGTGGLRARLAHDGPVTSLAFSPDGRLLLTGSEDRTARLWDTRTWSENGRFQHESAVTAVAFNPDSRHIATASKDRSARVWEAPSGRALALIKRERPVTAITFSPDGRLLATAGEERTVRAWLWRLEDMLAEGCRRLTRNLTADEWAQAFPAEPYRATCPALP
jgi:WD40 repeat protein